MAIKEFLNKHLTKIVVPVVALISIGVAGGVVLKDYNDYKAYETQYDKEAAELKGRFASLPEEVFIDDDYVTYSSVDEVASTKSSYSNAVILGARDADVAPLSATTAEKYVEIEDDVFSEAISGLDRKGGAISFSVTAEKHGMADIEIAMMTNWVDEKGEYHELENITDYIKIQINKLNVQTEELELTTDRDGFTSLILKGTNLVEGKNTLTLTTSAYNTYGNKDSVLYVMPDIRNVTYLCESPIAKIAD